MIVFLALIVSNVAFSEVKLVDGSENVLASNVAGEWVIDAALTERLWDKGTAEAFSGLKVTFAEDKKVLNVLNSKENGKTLKYEVYSVGKAAYITSTGEDLSKEYKYYAVVNRSGNPTLAFFNPDMKDGSGDWEFNITMLAKAEETKNDLLFLGGDRADESMYALKRVVE